jgi:hypothetical protein
MSGLMARSGLAGAAVVALLAAPSGAAAQGGVHVDPNTPAGKEYAIPLDSARREAAGKDNGTAVAPRNTAPSTGNETPLFGAGITPNRPRRSAPRAGAGASARAKRRHSTAAGARVSAAGSGGSNGTAATVGVALAVLALGGAFGYAFRRVARS